MSKKQRKLKGKGPRKADLADRHSLYQDSVQNVEFEVEFIAEKFKEISGRDARLIREDFCGTAQSACEWIKQHSENTAIGVDLDQEVLDWGRKHNVSQLNAEQVARLSLLQQDVFQVETPKVDIVLAMNFSYWYFKTREKLRSYFERVHATLKDDGVFFLDAFGGHEAYEVMEEETEHDGFSYIWDQAYYNPINNDYRCHIHFKFPDGSKMQNAFTYEWRLWSLPEIRELLIEAGFKKTTVYMQGWDEEEDEETDEFFAVEEADADPGWVAYLSATK